MWMEGWEDVTDSKLVRPGDPRVPCFAILSGKPSELKLVNLEGGSSSSVKISDHGSRGIVTNNGEVFAVTEREILKLHSDGTTEHLFTLPHLLGYSSKVVLFQKKIYILEAESVLKTSMLCFDPADNNLTVDLPGCGLGSGFCASATDDFICAMGGKESETLSMKFDPLKIKWIRNKAPMRKMRFHAAAATLDRKIYVMGGIFHGTSVEYYNYKPGKNSWTEISDMNADRYQGFSACVVGDRLYAVGGGGSSIEVYDKKKWTIVTKFQTKHHPTYSCFWPHGSHQTAQLWEKPVSKPTTEKAGDNPESEKFSLKSDDWTETENTEGITNVVNLLEPTSYQPSVLGQDFEKISMGKTKVSSERESEQDPGTESSVGSEVDFHEVKPAANIRRHKRRSKSRIGSSSFKLQSNSFGFLFGLSSKGKKGGGPRLKKKSTCTDDLLAGSTAGSLVTQVDAESCVVTRFGNLIGGGMAISKSIRKVIGSDSECLDVDECSLAFPFRSFVKSTPVAVTAEINSSKWPDNFIACTPILYVDAVGLRKKVHVKLPSMCVNIRSRKAKAHLLHLPDGETEWVDTGIKLPITNQLFFEFEWQDFSPITLGIRRRKSNIKALTYQLSGSIYTSDENEVSIAYHLIYGNKQKSASKSSPCRPMTSEWVNKKMENFSPPRRSKIEFNPFRVKIKESVVTDIICKKPDGFEFIPTGPFGFDVDDNFIENGFFVQHASISGELKGEKQLNLVCEISSNGEPKVEQQHGCTYMFATKKNVEEKSKQSEEASSPVASPSVNVSVDVHADQSQHSQTENTDNSGQNVTANKYIGPKAQVKYSESNNSATVASTGVPANQN